MDRVCSRRLTVAAPLVCMILLPRQVKTMEMSYDDNDSVLAHAAANKSPDVFEAVVSGIENDVTPQEVWNNDDSDLLIRHMFEGRMHP